MANSPDKAINALAGRLWISHVLSISGWRSKRQRGRQKTRYLNKTMYWGNEVSYLSSVSTDALSFICFKFISIDSLLSFWRLSVICFMLLSLAIFGYFSSKLISNSFVFISSSYTDLYKSSYRPALNNPAIFPNFHKDQLQLL